MKASRIDGRPPLLPLVNNGMSYDSLGPPSGIGFPVLNAVPASTFAERPDPAQPGQPNAPTAQLQSNKKRRPSKGKLPPEIRRSASTPHMRNLALATSGELSPTADKRRNKLGYHRTSVACGHCRRRKIRCLLASEDPQGRCSNCIRLKKECNFHPVEQTNPLEPRSQSSSKADKGSNAPSASTPSSPRPSATSVNEQIEEYRQYSTLPSNVAGARFGVQSELEIDPTQASHTDGGGPLQHPTFTYAHQIDSQWAPPSYFPQSSAAEDSPSGGYHWKASPSTAPSTYGSDSNMSGGQTPATMSTTSNMSYGPHHDGQGWAPPTRSMSYGNIEGLSQHFPNQHLATQHDYRGRSSPYSYPSQIETPGPMHGTSHPESAGPLSAPIVHSTPNYGYPPAAWNPYAMHGTSNEIPGQQGRSMTGHYFTEPTALGQVEEETVPPMQQYHGLPHFYSGS